MAKINEIVNLTPHKVTLVTSLGCKMDIPPSGKIARCVEKTSTYDVLQYSVKNMYGDDDIFPITVIKKELGACDYIPPKKPGVVYIVSLPVAQKLKRPDVLAIGESIRDENGNIVGCKSLALFT